MPSAQDPFDAFADALAERVAEKLFARLQPPPPARVALAEVIAHGAPSRQWVESRARKGEIVIKGPRGARYVDAADLERLLESTQIKRAPKPHEPDDGRAVLLALAPRVHDAIGGRS